MPGSRGRSRQLKPHPHTPHLNPTTDIGERINPRRLDSSLQILRVLIPIEPTQVIVSNSTFPSPAKPPCRPPIGSLASFDRLNCLSAHGRCFPLPLRLDQSPVSQAYPGFSLTRNME